MEPLKVVEDLIKCCPDKAKEILLRYCKADRDVLNEMMSSLLAAKNGQDLTTHAPNGADVTPTARYQGAYHGAHEIEAARPQQKMRQLSTNTRQYSLLSPPRTASSVTSHSVKDEFTAGEDIMLLIPTDRGITKEVVRMRTAPVENSLIAEDVIHGRDLVSSLCAVEQQHVYVPRGVDFEELDTFGASYSIKLTWRRSTAGSSHVTIFYVVRKGLMDTDVVLGAKDSGEDTSGTCNPAASNRLILTYLAA